MSLLPGTRLGAYEIVALAGVGGMGEVYRGRDTRLDRTVAIKILPSSTGTNDIDARQRFEREARVVATLNHPHICTLYDVGRHDDIDYLVMEFVEGETLADRLERGPLPISDAIRYALQIADALDRAHRQGIVHRDLKPGNVMVTAAGVKLLDFGLAKLRQPSDAGAPALSAIATIDRELTLKGTILGTLQYMSPEQVEGKETDARTDVFALGVVLYEMLTGRKAFQGKSHVSLMAAILEREPESMSSIRPVSPALERIVETCLAKDPDDRWQTAREVGRELKRAHEERPTESSAAASSRARVNRLPWIVAAVAASGFLAAVVPAVRHLREPVPEVSVRRFTIDIPFTPNPNAVAISPDGRRIVYLAVGTGNRALLWIRSLDSLTAQPLKGTVGAAGVVWSPDSRFVLFTSNGQLKKVDLLGGLPQTVTDLQLVTTNGSTANENGDILFAGNNLLYLVRASGGSPEQLDLEDSNEDSSVRYPHFLPDNEHFLFTAWSADQSRRAIYVGSIVTRARVRLLTAESMAAYAPPGLILYQRDGTLLAQPFDTTRLAITGEPIPIANNVFYNAGNGRASFSVSRTGALVYSNAASASALRRLLWYDRAGQVAEAVGKPDFYEHVRLSPDGRRVALARRNPDGGDLDIWLMELSSGIASRFTSGPDDETDPVWAPDSQAIAYNALKDKSRTIYVKQVGGNREEPMLQSEELQVSEDWSSDGKTLVFRVSNVATKVFAVPLTGERAVTKVFESESTKDEFQLSPDGRWIAFHSDESGEVEVYVAAFPSFMDKRQVSDGGGGQPRWRRDGRELFYRTVDGTLMSVSLKVGPSLEAGAPQPLFQTRINSSLGFDAFSPSADGHRFLALEPLETGDTPVINIVLDWAADLKN